MKPDYSLAIANLQEALKIAEWKCIQTSINQALALAERDLVERKITELERRNASKDTRSGTDRD